MFNIREYNRIVRDKAKEQITLNYNLAMMISSFVGCSMSGQKIPSFSEMYPSLVTSDPEQDFKDAHNGLTRAEYNRAMMAKEQMIDFANKRNKLLKEGKTNVN